MNFLGWLLLDEDAPQQLGGLSFTFAHVQYSGLMISKEPGTPFIWTAAVLFLAGLAALFYFPHRRIWIRLSLQGDGSAAAAVRLDSAIDFGTGREAALILRALGVSDAAKGG